MLGGARRLFRVLAAVHRTLRAPRVVRWVVKVTSSARAAAVPRPRWQQCLLPLQQSGVAVRDAAGNSRAAQVVQALQAAGVIKTVILLKEILPLAGRAVFLCAPVCGDACKLALALVFGACR